MKRSALIISIVVTAFVIGIVGAVVKTVSAQQESVKVQELQQAIQAREEIYKQTIDEANLRLEEANKIIAASVPATAQAVATQAGAVIPVEMAVKSAMEAVGPGEGLTGLPELVDYNGTAAYEVKLVDGSLVYIKAEDGSVLFNSLTGGPSKVVSDLDAQAAAINYMGGGQVLSSERTTYNNLPMYHITFASADEVYVTLSGQVAYVIQAAPVYSGGGYSGGSGVVQTSQRTKSSSSEEHEDEHESDDD